MSRARPDHFARKARKEGFVARSAFKLEELDGKYRVLRPRMRVLDLGAAPGSWMQYASARVGARGSVTGVDLKPVDIALPENGAVHTADVLRWDSAPAALRRARFDVVLSDMAPSTTGVRLGDHLAQLELADAALNVAGRQLRAGGHFVCKAFQGPRFEEFLARVRGRFEFVKCQKPAASRGDSVELFVVAMRSRQKPKPGSDAPESEH